MFSLKNSTFLRIFLSIEKHMLLYVFITSTECSLNIVFFSENFEIFRTLASLCFPSVSVCEHTPDRQNTSAAAELAEFRKITKFEGKTQYLMNTLYILSSCKTTTFCFLSQNPLIWKTEFFPIILPKLFSFCTQSLCTKTPPLKTPRQGRTHKLNFYCDFIRFKGY